MSPTHMHVHPNPMAKDRFQMECKSYADNLDNTWVLLGDFNDISEMEEQWGSERVNGTTMDKFVSMYNTCRLIDLESIGPRYTWRRQVEGRMIARKDLTVFCGI